MRMIGDVKCMLPASKRPWSCRKERIKVREIHHGCSCQTGLPRPPHSIFRQCPPFRKIPPISRNFSGRNATVPGRRLAAMTPQSPKVHKSIRPRAGTYAPLIVFRRPLHQTVCSTMGSLSDILSSPSYSTAGACLPELSTHMPHRPEASFQ